MYIDVCKLSNDIGANRVGEIFNNLCCASF